MACQPQTPHILLYRVGFCGCPTTVELSTSPKPQTPNSPADLAVIPPTHMDDGLASVMTAHGTYDTRLQYDRAHPKSVNKYIYINIYGAVLRCNHIYQYEHGHSVVLTIALYNLNPPYIAPRGAGDRRSWIHWNLTKSMKSMQIHWNPCKSM